MSTLTSSFTGRPLSMNLERSRALPMAPCLKPRPSRVNRADRCTAMMSGDLMEAARVTAFTGMACGGFVAGVELARQANKAIVYGRTMAPPTMTKKGNDMAFLATLFALDIFLVASMGLASAGVAHGLLSQVR